MKIVVVGGNGTIGQKVVNHFRKDNEVLVAGRSSAPVSVDLADSKSIAALFEEIGKVNAIICTAGEAKWAPFTELSEEDFYIGLRSKLMGQVNLVRIGLDYLEPSGSITLTTGILADDPVPMTTSAAMVNGALHSFVKALALELENKHRVNVVSSGLVEDAVEKYADYFPGHHPIPMEKMLRGYIRSVMGKGNGEIIRIYQ
ncbi:short chain dehydrogenase [Poritiphilus flavus]|uniref:Short chain dehydrogenase n=1 Tax=Poritiphilus flavus TaxID=2697053 RepID=A0A6L9E8Q3_9FLAO|nr:short chain dehydrogenase [Poritiphilus flavus]NAS11100.1 short chain dehydrogenase [Poritiphilus flavus]